MNEPPAMTGAVPPNHSGTTALTLDLNPDVNAVRAESAPPVAAPDEALLAKARSIAQGLIAVPAADLSRQDGARAAVEEMGRALQSESGRRSAMLQQPLRTLAQHGEDGGPVASGLLELRQRIESLDPGRFHLSPGWFGRVVSAIPGVGAPIRRYFAQFETAQTAIDAIVASLGRGRDQLKRDNTTLGEDQRAMRELTLRLER